jgi:hypothetical protein
MSNDSTIPSQLGPVDTMPSQLGPATGMGRQPGADSASPWSRLLVFAAAGALIVYLVSLYTRG